MEEAVTPDGHKTRRQIKVGDYKEYPNSVRLSNGEIFDYASVTDTPILMGELIDWYKIEEGKKEMHPVELAAKIHYKLVRIHPFDDGNGRISRLLMNYVLFKNDLPPVVIKTADKRNYLIALNQADAGDINAFVSYIANQLAWSLEISLKAAKGQSIEEPGDLDKKLSLLEQELEAIDSNEEVRVRLNSDVFFSIFKGWISYFLKAAIPEIQKFNKFFTGTRHTINISNGLSTVYFTNESANDLIEILENNMIGKINANHENESMVTIFTHYGTFIKGGLKTFGCNYRVDIKFDSIKFEVLVDVFEKDGGQAKQIKLYERLLHKSLDEYEIKKVIKHLTDNIYEHIDFHTKKNGLR